MLPVSFFSNYQLRPLMVSDTEEYYNLVSNNRRRLEIFFTGTVSRTSSLADTRVFVEEMIAKMEHRTYFPYLVIDLDNKLPVGFVDLKNIDWSIPKSELGCYIDSKYANKGIGYEAFSQFCQLCFDQLKFNKLFIRTHQTNHAARRLAEKCNFEVEGIIRRDYKTTSGEIVDLMYYGRLNDNI